MTAQDMIESAMRLLNVLPSGHSATSQERNDGLTTLNQMISSWSAKGILIPYVSGDAFLLTGIGVYSIGTGGTINTQRPLVIKSMKITVSNVPKAIEMVTAEQWARIDDFSRAQRYAEKAWFNPTSPSSGSIYLWPTPASGGLLDIQSLKALAQFGSLAGVVSLPEGYERAMRALLAVELAPEYGVRLSPELVANAKDALASIDGLNAAVLGYPPSEAEEAQAQ